MRRKVLTLLCAVAFCLLPAPVARAAATIRVGTYMNEPLVFLDAKGIPQGIYIDVLEGIAGEEGWRLEYVNGSWQECLARLRTGRIDLLLAIGYSEERRRQFDFTKETVVVNWGQVYVQQRSPISSMLDLTGRRLAVVREDVYYEAFKSIHRVLNIHPQFIELDSYGGPLRLLSGGKADAALVPRIYGAYHAKEFGLEKSSIMFSPTELRFAVPRGKRPELVEALDRHLRLLKADKGSSYYRSLNVWLEGVQALVFPRWLNPAWVVTGVASVILLIVGMNLVLRWQVRVKTNALKETLAAQERIESELRIAHNIQMGSVRRDFPSLPGYEMYAVLQPARAVGGDFYDWFFADQDHLCFVLGDVSGKGVPAALLMAATKTLLNATGAANPHPKTMLEAANRQVLIGNEACMFVTVFCGVLDVRTGVICYTNAGHNPPVVVRNGRETEYLEGAWSTAIGILEGAAYEEAVVTLHPGDALFLYTDGVTEARSERREMFSEERLKNALSGGGGGSAKDLVQRTLEGVKHFGGDAPQADDIAMLAVRRIPRDAHPDVTVRWSLGNDLAELAAVSERVVRIGKDHRLPDEVTADVRLALEEVLSNIIRHGYAGQRDREIRVQVALGRDAIALEVQDEGTPFNPLEHPGPDTGIPAEERGAGGHGILLVRRVMDEVAYRREGERNVLVMSKCIPRPPGGGGDPRRR